VYLALLHPAGLTENCRGCATQSLQFLKDLKSKASLQRADTASIRIVVQKILRLGEVMDYWAVFSIFIPVLLLFFFTSSPLPMFRSCDLKVWMCDRMSWEIWWTRRWQQHQQPLRRQCAELM
jgi:hypothetical protein